MAGNQSSGVSSPTAGTTGQFSPQLYMTGMPGMSGSWNSGPMYNAYGGLFGGASPFGGMYPNMPGQTASAGYGAPVPGSGFPAVGQGGGLPPGLYDPTQGPYPGLPGFSGWHPYLGNPMLQQLSDYWMNPPPELYTQKGADKVTGSSTGRTLQPGAVNTGGGGRRTGGGGGGSSQPAAPFFTGFVGQKFPNTGREQGYMTDPATGQLRFGTMDPVRGFIDAATAGTPNQRASAQAKMPDPGLTPYKPINPTTPRPSTPAAPSRTAPARGGQWALQGGKLVMQGGGPVPLLSNAEQAALRRQLS